jgi:diaminobutyrate-2-oxoglutarate transaminase
MAEYKGDPQKENEMAKLSWPEAPKRVTSELPGPKSKELYDKEAAHRIPVRAMPAALGWVLSEAFGSTIKDADGNIFIDLAASVGVNNVGHCHPKVVEIIRKECGVLGHSPDSPTPYTQKLGEKLTQIVPGNLKGNVSIAYGLSGSSAIEMAIKFAKMASKKPVL